MPGSACCLILTTEPLYMVKQIRLFLLIAFILPQALQAQLSAEQQQIKQTFFSFLKFYQRNEKTFNSFRLYRGIGKDNAPPYHIQWKEAERYFAWLRKSVPYVGEAYIRAERGYFTYYDSCFKADPDEEMPVGFDYDRWAGGQESIQYTIQWYLSEKNTFTVTINGDDALLRIGSSSDPADPKAVIYWSEVPFKKEKGKWKMADNVYPADPESTEEN